MKIDLNGIWTINSPSFNNVQGTVPGSVLNTLVENKLIDDPYFRSNEYEAKKISFEDFDYDRDFELSEEDLKRSNFLCFDGLDTIADVYINNVHVAKSLDMNIHQKVLLDNKILKRKNHIKVSFVSPYRYIKEYKNQEGFKTFSYVVTEPECCCIRKAHSMYGWDWGPNLGDMGIFRDIYILSTTIGHFDNYRLEQTFLEDGSVKLNIKTTYKKLSEGKITALIYLDSNEIVAKSTQKFSETNEFEFIIKNPKLWYPNGIGEQILYSLVFVVENENEQIIDKKKIGIRKIKIDDSFDQYGRNLAVYVNGVHVFLKGADYIPQDAIIGRVNEKRTRRLLKLCKDFNHNVIRVWGGGYFPDDYFYDICDEYGILVFQDLMFACGIYNSSDKDFMDLIGEETRITLRRIRNHPCLFLLSGNNEIEDGVRGHSFRAALDYQKIFIDYLPNIVKEEINIYYLTSSPTSGDPIFAMPNDNNYLDAHNWEVWHRTQPFEYFKTIYPRLLSEFGCQSMPTMDTIKRYALPEEMDLESKVMDDHQKNKSCNFKILYYIENLYRKPNSFDELVYLSTTSVAEGIKTCIEHLRRHKDRCNGAIYWQLNDDWPGQSWSSIDYYFGLKALHYYSKRFYAPHLISVDGEGNNVKIAVSNDTASPCSYKMRYVLSTMDGKIIKEVHRELSLPETSCKYVDEYKNLFSSDDEVLYVELFDKDDNLLSSNFYQPKKDKELHYKKANVKIDRIDDKSFKVSTDYFAKNIYIEPHDNECVLSDNYFTLLASTSRIITSEKELDYSKIEVQLLNDICA